MNTKINITYNDITYTEGCILNNLQEKDLEELVISFIQLEKGYYFNTFFLDMTFHVKHSIFY